MADPEISAAKQDGRFKKGRSGNPRGKPRGARHATTLLAERLMAGDAEGVVKAMVAAAMKGDTAAAKLILERIAPIRRGRPISLDLPTINGAADVSAAAGAITSAVANATLTPEEGLALGGVVEFQRRAIETNEMAKRLDALERKQSDADASEPD